FLHSPRPPPPHLPSPTRRSSDPPPVRQARSPPCPPRPPVHRPRHPPRHTAIGKGWLVAKGSGRGGVWPARGCFGGRAPAEPLDRSEEHTSELQSRGHLVCRLLLE